jgi:ribonuclease HI
VAGNFLLYTDGAARGNPGPAAIGAALYLVDDGTRRLVGEVSEAIGPATNNVAEYKAVLAGLALARRHHPDRLVLRADSQLLIRQLQGRYRVKNLALRELYEEVVKLLATLPAYRLEHVPREENIVAYALANSALDR